MFRIVSSHAIEYHVPDHPVLNRDNIALTAVVETKANANGSTPARFVVANTHLLFNPNVSRLKGCTCVHLPHSTDAVFFGVQRGEIKLAQLDMLLKHLTSLRQERNPMLPVLLSGDFNLAPHSPLYHFLSSGELDASGLSRYGLSGQNLNTYALKVRRSVKNTELDLASAYAQAPDDRCTGEPKFTIFHSGSKGTVDYIWYTRSSLHCHGVVEMIPAGLLFKHDELPTTEHSSDHLSLIADFSLR
ncbi:unnamed protein product [Phytophthora lilii]|uniref:Unnamed protein product n=1 Tax=Phytophthora lilii TaxID=2077276 RepID=A0A9W6UDB3_9STRA|nr:unnamed protein product [Phytophthora lilii]